MRVRFAVLMLASAFALTTATMPIAAAASQSEYDIAFDGHCDGMHLTLPRFSDIPYSAAGSRTGCASGDLYGVARPDRHGHYGIERGTEIVADDWGTPLTVIKSDHTWVTYEVNEDDEIIYVLDSGTWSRGLPGAAGSPSSASRPTRSSSASASRPSSAASRHIRMDGFDDEDLYLSIPSNGLHTKRTIDGLAVCCKGNGYAAVIGVEARIAGQPNTLVVSYHMRWFESGWDSLIAFFPDQTWIEFDRSGVVGTGTWHVRD
jgi:hypothetical protein